MLVEAVERLVEATRELGPRPSRGSAKSACTYSRSPKISTDAVQVYRTNLREKIPLTKPNLRKIMEFLLLLFKLFIKLLQYYFMTQSQWVH